VFLEFSRAFEKEADLLALDYLYRSGYDPKSLIGFFGARADSVPKVFSTHLLIEERTREAQAGIARIAAAHPAYRPVTPEFDHIKEALSRR
jgi:predicted Zn-dependent protease